jgi:glutamyl-Q tRNA(Asp) synthetase
VPDEEQLYQDVIFGPVRQNLQQDVGDFVLRRADGLFAYQLAVVVDDIDSGVNQVVRGADLLSSTPRQNFLYRCLQQPEPEYYHLPLALGDDAQKLSKRHGQFGVVTEENGCRALWWGLDFLGQQPPRVLKGAPAEELISWGLANFAAGRIKTAEKQTPDLEI